MKKFLIFIALISLTACGTSTTESAGKLVSCNSIHRVAAENESQLICLDGGQGVAVQSLRGPMLVNVWGTWCAPCKREIPIFADFAQQKSRVQLVGVDVEEKNINAGRKFVLSHGMTWPILFEADGSTRGYFGMGVPVTWFIDANGRVIYKKIGPFKSLTELNSLVTKYLGAA